uniref:U30-Theraphotoxin-Sfo1a_1 n=1 Tax=Selenotholus foelschei TaxID=1905327 RepID=A0A482Z864_9ARAC
MKGVMAICGFLGFLCAVGFALRCSPCNPERCSPEFNPKNCKVGVTKDVCNCCPACFKDVGEDCGGPWNFVGLCADHLICIKPSPPPGKPDPYYEFNAKGKCRFQK